VVIRQPEEAVRRPKDPIAYLSELLSSRVRAQVLTYLVARADEAFSLTQIARGLALSISSVQHECYKLERLGILQGRPRQGSRRYQLDQTFLPTAAVIQLVISAFTPQVLLRLALEDLAGKNGLQVAQVAGPLPPTTADSTYLLLVGELSLDQLATAHERVARLLDLPVDSLQVAFFQPAQWQSHVASRNELVTRLQSLPRIPIIGSLGEATPAG